MRIEDIKNIDQDDLLDKKQLIREISESLFEGEFDFSPGSVLHKLVVEPSALFLSIYDKKINRTERVNSLSRVVNSENVDEEDEDAINNLLSNYFVDRNPSTPATGVVNVILNDNRYTPISNTTVLELGGLQFRPVQSFAGVSKEEEITNESDVLITKYTDDLYLFPISVLCTTTGSEGNIPAGAVFSANTVQNNIEGFISASTFVGGRDEETNQELLERALSSIVSDSLSNVLSIKSVILKEFNNIQDVSILPSSAFNTGRLNGIFGTNFNSSDIVVKTNDTPIQSTLIKQFIYDDQGDFWYTSVSKNELPVIIDIQKITDLSTGETIDNFEFDFVFEPGYGFSVNQSVFIKFPSVFSLEGGNERLCSVDIQYWPEVNSVSHYFSHRQNQPVNGSFVVKAPNTAFVYLDILVDRNGFTGLVDIDSAKKDLVKDINNCKLGKRYLDYSFIVNSLHKHIPSDCVINSPLNIRVNIFTPYGNYWVFSNQTNKVGIENTPSKLVYTDNTVYTTSPDLINIEVY